VRSLSQVSYFLVRAHPATSLTSDAEKFHTRATGSPLQKRCFTSDGPACITKCLKILIPDSGSGNPTERPGLATCSEMKSPEW
jgi:hypothetical protein